MLRTVAELQGVKIAKFSDFGLFSPYKTPKTYVPMTSLQHIGYMAEWLRFFHVIRQRSFPTTSGMGAGDHLTCPKFRHMANGYSYTEFYNTARQIWTKEVWKRAILRTDVLSHKTSSPLPPKSPPNPILGDLSVQTLLYIILYRKTVYILSKVV